MYGLYKEFCEDRGKEPLPLPFYRHVFNTCFNLTFHRPHTDTCTHCDKLQNVIELGDEQAKKAAIAAKELHLRKAKSAKIQMEKVG